MPFLFVALGGAVGAAGRYAISLLPVETDFPLLTFLTNLLGTVMIGFITGIAGSRDGGSSNAVLFWKTGVCGGFTTFSTFSLETLTLFENGKYGTGTLYMALSLVCCVAGVVIGRKLSALAA